MFSGELAVPIVLYLTMMRRNRASWRSAFNEDDEMQKTQMYMKLDVYICCLP